jgi:DNA polymerase III epsilon subunit-like protein
MRRAARSAAAALARALGYAQGSPRGREPSLELLARQLALPVYEPHHALGDAVTTAAVFLAMATKSREAWRASRLKAGDRAVPGCPIRQERLLKSKELPMIGNRQHGYVAPAWCRAN